MSLQPNDTPAADWSLYFDHTYLLHVKEGPVYVRVQGGRDGETLLMGTTDRGNTYKQFRAADLRVFWPSDGAYNSDGGAVYIGRRARRTMKKSASQDHYFVMWPEFHAGVRYMDLIVFQGPNFLTYKTAREVMERGVMSSVAISTDLIVAKTNVPNRYEVICYGEPAGFVEGDQFFPEWDGTPAAKMTRALLKKENILCI